MGVVHAAPCPSRQGECRTVPMAASNEHLLIDGEPHRFVHHCRELEPGEAAWNTAFHDGRGLGMDQAIAYALERPERATV